MKKLILYLGFLFLASMCFNSSYAQYVEGDTSITDKKDKSSSSSFKDKLYYGGNLSFNIVQGYLLLETSPLVGYKITESLSAGIGGKFLFARDLIYKENFSIYGGGVFSRYKVFSQFFLHAEYELLNAYNRQPLSPIFGQRDFASMLFVGGGYATGEGGFGMQIMLLYDLLNHPNSPYQGSYIIGPLGPPVILRVGFTVGF